MSRYHDDLADCKGYADQVRIEMGVAKSPQIGDREKSRVVKRCMRGRGYKVLN